jgi:hypothetical protein
MIIKDTFDYSYTQVITEDNVYSRYSQVHWYKDVGDGSCMYLTICSKETSKELEEAYQVYLKGKNNMIGTYGGYTIKVDYEGFSYELHTKDGVRGFGYTVDVSYEDSIWKASFKGRPLEITKVLKLVPTEEPLKGNR